MRRLWLALAVALLACAHERIDPGRPAPGPPSGDAITRDVSGGAAPGGTVHALDGKEVDLATLWERQPVVIVFYMGHWCHTCEHQLGDLDKRLADFTAAHAAVIAISTDSVDDATALHDRLGLHFDLYSDPDEAAATKWGVADFSVGVAKPATFVVEPGGSIRFRHVGKTELDRPKVDDILAALAPDKGS
jgi:peroxiredoxin